MSHLCTINSKIIFTYTDTQIFVCMSKVELSVIIRPNMSPEYIFNKKCSSGYTLSICHTHYSTCTCMGQTVMFVFLCLLKEKKTLTKIKTELKANI